MAFAVVLSEISEKTSDIEMSFTFVLLCSYDRIIKFNYSYSCMLEGCVKQTFRDFLCMKRTTICIVYFFSIIRVLQNVYVRVQ